MQSLHTPPDQIKQEQEIQRHTAELVFSPEFIPYYLDIKEEFQLSHSATLVYGFIRFYLKSASQRFYFTNIQIAEIMSVTETWISEAVSELKSKKLIALEYQIKSGGGKIRFVTWVYGRPLRGKYNSDFGKSRSGDEATTSGKAEVNNNTINYNTIKDEPIVNKSIQELARLSDSEIRKLPAKTRKQVLDFIKSQEKGWGKNRTLGYSTAQNNNSPYEKKPLRKGVDLTDLR